MAINPTVTETIVFDDLTYKNTYTQSAGSENNLDEPIPDASTDLAVTWTADVSEMINFIMVSDQALTVKTNSAGTPTQTISLAADVPLFWSVNNGMSMTNPLTADVTALYVTNASGEAATLKVRMTQDPTP